MSKPVVTMRKPPSLDAFVAGELGSQVPERSVRLVPEPTPQGAKSLSGSRRGELTRTTGRVTRRMTLYVPPDLARRVLMLCAESGREISDVGAEALARYLELA